MLLIQFKSKILNEEDMKCFVFMWYWSKKKFYFKFRKLLEKQNAYVILLLCCNCFSKCILQFIAPYTDALLLSISVIRQTCFIIYDDLLNMRRVSSISLLLRRHQEGKRFLVTFSMPTLGT